MFGRSRPIPFDPYGRSRSRRRLPRWLLLLLLGAAAGAGGVVYVQQRHLPPRLSPAESATLTRAYERVDAERTGLAAELADTRTRLDAALAERLRLANQVERGRAAVDRLEEDLAWFVDALPPDPRGAPVEIRAAAFSAGRGALDWHVVLARKGGDGPDRVPEPSPAVLRLTLSGAASDRGPSTIALEPVALAAGRHEVVEGRFPLPAGFRPSEATIRVYDQPDGRVIGMRVIRVP